MVRFLEIQGSTCQEILHRSLPKEHILEKKKLQGEGAPTPEKPSLAHFHYGNTIELGAAGHFVTSGSMRPACFKPGLPI